MQLKMFLPIVSLIILSCNTSSSLKKVNLEWDSTIKPPVAEIKPKELVAHGDVRIDNYYWMNDYFKKGPDSTKAVDYLKAENAYQDTMMSATKKFRENLFADLKGRIKEKDESVPYKDNGYWYYTRFEE